MTATAAGGLHLGYRYCVWSELQVVGAGDLYCEIPCAYHNTVLFEWGPFRGEKKICILVKFCVGYRMRIDFFEALCVV